jgi:drug/metabolite transporter (DMT)-like permease
VIAAGVGVALAASVANAFAVVLQAAEDRRSPASQAGRFALLRSLAARPRWLAGTGLMVLAWPLQILALALAPITAVQPTLSAAQLVLLVVARVKLREQVGLLEALGALAIVAGVSAVIAAAPHHSNDHPAVWRAAMPIAVIGLGATAAYVAGRRQPRRALALVIGAGLAYAWVDFVNKLLAGDISSGRWALAIVWLAATVGFGALAFLQETTALQRRPAVTVSPVVGAVQDPLPVLMALWAGVEAWSSAPDRLLALVCGLALVTAGAAILGRSKAVARVAGDERPATGSRHRLGFCAPDGRERVDTLR